MDADQVRAQAISTMEAWMREAQANVERVRGYRDEWLAKLATTETRLAEAEAHFEVAKFALSQLSHGAFDTPKEERGVTAAGARVYGVFTDDINKRADAVGDLSWAAHHEPDNPTADTTGKRVIAQGGGSYPTADPDKLVTFHHSLAPEGQYPFVSAEYDGEGNWVAKIRAGMKSEPLTDAEIDRRHKVWSGIADGVYDPEALQSVGVHVADDPYSIATPMEPNPAHPPE